MLGFTGPFGDSNYGDYAMFVNDVYALNIQEFMVFTYNEDFLGLMKRNYFASHSITECVVDVDYDYKEYYTEQYHTEYDIEVDTPIEIRSYIRNIDEIESKISRITALVVCGGGYFNHAWNAKHRKKKLLSILAVILAADTMHKKIFFLGNTYGPFDGSIGLFSNFFNSLVYVQMNTRDDLYSIPNLRRIGFMREVQIVPDDLYFLSTELKMKLEEMWLPNRYVIIECYLSVNEMKKHLLKVQEFVNFMKNFYGLYTLFLPLDRKWGGEYQGEFLRKNINDIMIVPVDQGFVSIEMLNQIVSHAEIILCQRYHLFLTALTHNIPCVQALKEVCGNRRYYYSKAKGLLRQVFANQLISEEAFLVFDFWEGLQSVKDNYEKIVALQKTFYNAYKLAAEEKMYRKREALLQEIQYYDKKKLRSS